MFLGEQYNLSENLSVCLLFATPATIGILSSGRILPSTSIRNRGSQLQETVNNRQGEVLGGDSHSSSKIPFQRPIGYRKSSERRKTTPVARDHSGNTSILIGYPTHESV